MKVLVTGGNGQVGWELKRALLPLGEVISATRADVDFADPAAVEAFVVAAAPDIVVNAAAYTAVDRAEDEADLAFAVNCDAVGAMARAARNCGSLFVHYSTDYVFDGTARKPYSECDATNPQSAYGRSKLAGEKAIEATGGDWLVFRTSWVYASRGQNFVRTMLKLGASRERLSVVCDQHGAPTSARTIADLTAHAVFRAMQERRCGAFESGVFHMTASGTTTWHAFAEAIFARAKRDYSRVDLLIREVLPIPAADYPTKVLRPAYSVLNNARFDARFSLYRAPWENGLALVLDELHDA